MRLQRRLDDHLRTHLAFEQVELGVLGKALGAMHSFALDLKYLVANNQRFGAVTPFDNFRVGLDLFVFLSFVAKS